MAMGMSGLVQTFRMRILASRSLRNVMWNMVGGLWAGILVIVATPWYVVRLGLEGYAIVGLWLMMQVMLGLLDMGLGATLVREFADARRGAEESKYRQDLLRTLEIVYGSTAAILCLLLVTFAGAVAQHWLRVPTASSPTVALAIRLMALTLGFQFPCVLYINGLAGIQEHGRMNALQILWNGLRYGCGMVVLYWQPGIVTFFLAQVMIAACQVLSMRSVLWRSISMGSEHRPAFRPDLLRHLWRFSAGMAATAGASVLLANSDRLVLSRMLPTSELGKYTVAFTATGILQMGIQPFYRAFFPRYAELVSLGDEELLRREYLRSCQLLAIIILSLGAIGWVYSHELFAVWLQSQDETIIKVFRWLLLGMTCAGLVWLPAALQQAHGHPGLHVAMTGGALILGLPVMVLCIIRYGAAGATVVWVLHGISGLTLELWLMHRRMLKGHLLDWYRRVVLSPGALVFLVVLASYWLFPHGLGRLATLAWIGTVGLASVFACVVMAGRGTLFPDSLPKVPQVNAHDR